MGYADPLANDDFPLMCTFPSVKDTAYRSKHPEKTSVQILACAEFGHFEEWAGHPSGRRGEMYEEYKRKWQERGMRVLMRYYPKLDGRVEFVDVSTPLSA